MSYTTSITLDQSPADVFAAVCNVHGWWSEEIVGSADEIGARFKHHFRDLHRCTIEVKQLIPGEKVVWTVVDNFFSFTEDPAEWTGTDIVFDITQEDGKTVLNFTHVNLVPECQCYVACSDGWQFYIQESLRDLIATGRGRPNVGQPVTDSELALAD